jgi:hypothetical protein
LKIDIVVDRRGHDENRDLPVVPPPIEKKRSGDKKITSPEPEPSQRKIPEKEKRHEVEDEIERDKQHRPALLFWIRVLRAHSSVCLLPRAEK